MALLVRDGDPRGAVGVAVSTAGIDPLRGAEPSVALAALLEARLVATKGLPAVNVIAGWDGYRVHALIGDAAEGRATINAIRRALLTPVLDAAPELVFVARRLSALARRPLADAALLDTVRCAGEPFALPGGGADDVPTPAAKVEAWRRAAHGEGRIAVAVVGPSEMTGTSATAITGGPAWPRATAGAVPAPEDTSVHVYEDAAAIAPGGARATIAVHTEHAEQAVAAAEGLGDPRGVLASRLFALEAKPSLEEVSAAAHPGEGCVAVTLLFSAHDRVDDTASRIATAVALARQEVLAELADVKVDDSFGRMLAARAGDPRDAADRAAWWTLVGAAPRTPRREPWVSLAVGLSPRRDAVPGDPTVAALAPTLRAALDRATVAWHEPVIDARSRIERGQGELWVLLGSPCGTSAEGETDAGLSAVVALAAADHVSAGARIAGVTVEGWATADGVGIIAHAPALPGETSLARARRVADIAARSFAADPLDAGAIANARASLLARAQAGDDARGFVELARVLAPGHPSWLAPLGTSDALGRASDAAVLARATALRAGPLRVAILADEDMSQSNAVVRAVDRWVARGPDDVRECTPTAVAPLSKPGTYALEVPNASASEAWLAFPLLTPSDESRTAAAALAGALEGNDGLLERALGSGLARTFGAKVVGSSRQSALVVRISSIEGALDPAVAAVHSVFDRMREGALTEDDRNRAVDALAANDLASSLDPRGRLTALWRGEAGRLPAAGRVPSLATLRAFAASTLRNEALVIVASRPSRDVHGGVPPAKTP